MKNTMSAIVVMVPMVATGRPISLFVKEKATCTLSAIEGQKCALRCGQVQMTIKDRKIKRLQQSCKTNCLACR